jgi:hypothetical protein
MIQRKGNNDFSKFSCFAKGLLVTAEVIEKSDRKLNHTAKMYFNRLLAACKLFEKYLHANLGPELAEHEDEINSSIVNIVWNLYEMTAEERGQFIDHINKFDPDNV